MTRLTYADPVLKEFHHDKIIRFYNCQLIGHGITNGQDELWIKNGKILSGQHIFYVLKCKSDIDVDCKGLILTAGFVDIQVNGAFGVDFTSCSTEEFDEGVNKVAKGLTQFGVTAFCPTLVSSAPDIYRGRISLLKTQSSSFNTAGARVLGWHLEGPFISIENRGCHVPNNVVGDFGENQSQTIESIYGNVTSDNVALVTLAPELPGSSEAIRYLKKTRGICVSMGHTSASLEEGEKAMDAGVTCITHMFNAMNPFHHRRPGLLGVLVSPKHSIFYGIIADGFHNSESALRVAHSTCPEGMVLVTDCIAAVGMGDGKHRLGDQNVIVNGNKAHIEENMIVAGSVATMPHCIKTLINSVNCNLEHAIKCATYNPASVLDRQEIIGTLGPGANADFVLMDQDVNIYATFISSVRHFLHN